jgi:hypothetical protein
VWLERGSVLYVVLQRLNVQLRICCSIALVAGVECCRRASLHAAAVVQAAFANVLPQRHFSMCVSLQFWLARDIVDTSM